MSEDTPIEVIKKFFPDASEEAAEYFLWNGTAYPFAGEGYLRRQIARARGRSGGDIGRAIEMAYEDLERAMARHSS